MQVYFGQALYWLQEVQQYLTNKCCYLLESWNALHNRYANKNYYFRYILHFLVLCIKFTCSHRGMALRAAIAAIDHNTNISREQVVIDWALGSM